jgi:hypothetical protein
MFLSRRLARPVSQPSCSKPPSQTAQPLVDVQRRQPEPSHRIPAEVRSKLFSRPIRVLRRRNPRNPPGPPRPARTAFDNNPACPRQCTSPLPPRSMQSISRSREPPPMQANPLTPASRRHAHPHPTDTRSIEATNAKQETAAQQADRPKRKSHREMGPRSV